MIKINNSKFKINNLMFMIMLVFILTTASISVFAAQYENEGVIDVSFVNQDPDPVEPGNYMDLRWKVENIGKSTLSNVQVELLPKYPFSLDPGESSVKTIRTLDSLQKGNAGYIIKFKVRVDENAVEGQNLIQIKYKTENSGWTTTEALIDIQTTDANLGVDSVQTSPSEILPGENFDIKINIKNFADSIMKDVSVKLDLMLSTVETGGVSATSKSDLLDAVPFAPVDSATEKRIKSLSAGAESTISYKLVAYPTAESKVYKLPIVFTYYDNDGNMFTKNDIIGVVVGAKPDISVILDQSEIKQSGTKGEVTVKFVNKGLADIKFLNVKIQPMNNVDILSTKEVYIGNIDSDDYETADYELFIKSEVKDKLVIPIHYDYMDVNNKVYSADVNLDLMLYSAEEAKQLGEQPNNTFVYIIIGIVAVVILLLIIRAIMKRKKE